MRPGVAWSISRSVGRSVTLVSPAETAEPIEIPAREGAILRAKIGRPRTRHDMSGDRYTQIDSTEGRTGTVRMPTGVLDVDAHRRYLANTIQPRAASIQPYANLL